MKNLYIRTKLRNRYRLKPLWSLVFLLPFVLDDLSLTMMIASLGSFLCVLYVFIVLMIQVTNFPVLVLHNDRFNILDTTLRTFIQFWKAVYRENYITDIDCIVMSDEGIYIRFNDRREYGISYVSYDLETQNYIRGYFHDKIANKKCKQCENR